MISHYKKLHHLCIHQEMQVEQKYVLCLFIKFYSDICSERTNFIPYVIFLDDDL